MPTLSFSWSTQRDANDGYVLEECTTNDGHVEHRIEYGPMPPHIVPAFVHSRRRIVAAMMKNDGAVQSLE